MDPILIGAGIAAGSAVVSGIMQWYQSEKARGATNDRLREIEAMFNAIVPPQFDISVWDSPELAAAIPEPSFNWEAITPEQYQQVQQFNPELAEFVAQKAPELPQVTAAATEGRGAQLSALQRYRQIAAGETDPELAQLLAESSQRAQRDSQSRSASILQDAARRGQAGSNATLAAQMQSGSDAFQMQGQQSMAAAAEAYRNRLRALDQSAQLGGQIRSSEMGEQARNADIINQFNQSDAARRQAWMNQGAQMRNDATQGNIATAQRISDANVANRNSANVDNQARYNALQAKQYDYRAAERQAAIDREKTKNSIKQQQFGNAMQIAQGKSGIAQTGIDYMRQDARDRNQMVQGVADGIGAAALYGSRYYKPEDAPKGESKVTGVALSSPRSPTDAPAWADNQSRQQANPYARPYSYDDYWRGM